MKTTMKKRNLLYLCFPLLLAAAASCTKGFLDAKPSKSLLVPTTLSDFRALLDFSDNLNVAPGLNVISSDDFYRSGNTFVSLNPVGQNTYLWSKDLYSGTTVQDWTRPYADVFAANVVLDGLKALGPGSYDPGEYNAVKGTALFLRGYSFYGLAQEFAANYDPATANTLPGIPLHLTSDVNVIGGRGTLEQTYAQITADLSEAATLLPANALFKSRPNIAAARAMLARVYLTMGDYGKAQAAATASLQQNGALTDYNTLSATASRPFPYPLPDNAAEVSFYATLISTSSYNSSSSTLIDTGLYASYDANDLRKALYFKTAAGGQHSFKGTYSGNTGMFAGTATDEVYLIRAECYARQGDAASAMADLNTLLATRWKTGTYVPFTAADADSALGIILTERRKELVGRGLRWGDLKRLNTDNRFATTLKRIINGQTYTLAPGSPNYVLPIPDNELHTSGIPQNPRN